MKFKLIYKTLLVFVFITTLGSCSKGQQTQFETDASDFLTLHLGKWVSIHQSGKNIELEKQQAKRFILNSLKQLEPNEIQALYSSGQETEISFSKYLILHSRQDTTLLHFIWKEETIQSVYFK